MAFIVSSLLVLSYENFREFLDKMCRCDGMVDVADSKSAGGDSVWVRVPPPAPRRRKRHIACGDFFQKSPRAHFAASSFQTEPAPDRSGSGHDRASAHHGRNVRQSWKKQLTISEKDSIL